jgi:putative ABC transport system ATP-binding protein
MSIVRLKRVSRVFKLGEKQITAVDNIDLALNKGEFVVLKGMSGSGKSSLLNLIGAIDEPSSGDVIIAGENLCQLSDNQKAKLRSSSIGFIFQSFNLIPVLTALENVQYPLTLQKVKNTKFRAQQALEDVGLGEYLNHKPNQLSGGQMQRVAIARAIVTEPEIILADEPTANLDSETSIEIMNLLGDLNKKNKVTFLFATHHDFVMSRASRVLQLKDGRLIGDCQNESFIGHDVSSTKKNEKTTELLIEFKPTSEQDK